MNAMYRPGVTAPCRTFQSRPRTGGDRPLVDPGLYPSEAGDPPDLHFEASFGTPKRPRGRFGVPRFALQEQFSRFSGVDSHLLGTAPDKHQDRHKERPRRGPNPAFRSELWDPKAASRPVWGPQVRLTRTILPISRCGFTPPRDRARQAPRSAQRAAATGTQPSFRSELWDPKAAVTIVEPVWGPQPASRLTRTILGFPGVDSHLLETALQHQDRHKKTPRYRHCIDTAQRRG